MTGLYIDVVCYSVLYTIFTIHLFSNLNLSRIKRTTVEISVLILSCVILGLNPVLPVLLYFFLISRFVTLYGFDQIKYIHTYSGVTKLDRMRNERIRGIAKVGEISKNVQESSLKWYGHVFFFFLVLHTIVCQLRAHAFARSVTVARSSAVQASSSRRHLQHAHGSPNGVG